MGILHGQYISNRYTPHCISNRLQQTSAGLVLSAIVSLLLLQTPRAAEVAGVLTTDTRWSASASPYQVTDHLTVPEGVTLTIDPGVTVQFNQHVGLFVGGTLHAVGTVQNLIIFSGSSGSPGWWRGILVTGTGSAQLESCQISDAGYWDGVGLLKAGSGSLTLKNSTLRGQAGDGLRLSAGSSSLILQGNHFQENTLGVRLGIGASFDDNTSTFTGNGLDVHLDAGTISGEAVWNLHPSISLYLSGHVTVDPGGSLVIGAGTVLKLAQNSALFVRGTLVARGEAARPIYFTDWRDDSVGGDANRDGTVSAASPGWWRALFVQEGGSASLAHCTLRYAGYWDGVGIHKSGSGTLVLDQCAVAVTSGHGLRIQDSTGLSSLEQSTFTQNAHSGLCLVRGYVEARACTFTSNGQYGIVQEPTDALVYSQNQFGANAWGDVGINGGSLTGARTWSKGGTAEPFTLVVRDHLTVPAGSSLAIQPGVTVRFAQNVGMFVTGTVEAMGAADDAVRFTGLEPQPGWWRGIHVTEAGSARLQWCQLSYAGYWDGVGLLKTGTGALLLKNCILRSQAGDGLRLAAGSSSVLTEANSFQENTRGVRLEIGASWDDTTSSFSGNGVDMHANDGSIRGEVTWNLNPAYSFYVPGHVTVESGGALVVRSGSVVKFAQNCGLFINGRFLAQGTAALPTYFTDWRDDAAGGDANRDAGESAPQPGWWRGVLVQPEGSATFQHCVVRYAGYWDGVGIQKTGAGSLELDRCTVAHNQGHGLRIYNSAGPTTLEASVFSRNTQSGLSLASGRVAANGCAFTDNGQYGIAQEPNDTVDYSKNQFSGNAVSSVGMNGGTLTGERTWSKGGGDSFHIDVLGHLAVPAGTQLAIKPGVTVQFSQHVALFVSGALDAAGTSDQSIRFIGRTRQPGWWRGIHVTEAGTARLEWCQLSDSGYWDGVGLLKVGSGPLTVSRSVFRDQAGDGLRIENSTGAHQIEACTFTGNTRGVRVRNQTNPVQFRQARIESNQAYGVLNEGSAEVDARQCTWGHSSGPYHEKRNPSGTGNAVSDLVLFEPWLDGAEAGVLTVVLEPEGARQAEAAWSVDGVTWNVSGATLTLAPGSYSVQCRTIQGWETPAPEHVTLSDKATTSLTRTYARRSEFTPGTVTAGPPLPQARMGHNVATLPDGRVALFGGHGTGFKSLATAEIWDPAATAFSTLTMQHSHDWPAFAQLSDGRFLLAGGSADLGIPSYAQSELFDPKANSFTPVGDLARFRSGSGAVALSGGHLLIAGAWWTHNDAHTYGELFDPGTGSFTATGPLNYRRAYPVVLPASDGRAVVVGGYGITGGTDIMAVEQFDPATSSFSVLQEQLFVDDPGWSLSQDQRPVSTQQLADGKFLLLARRTRDGVTSYLLFTFNPATKTLERVPVTPDLPDSRTRWLWTPVVDSARGQAHILEQPSQSSAQEVSVSTLDLATGALVQSVAPTRLEPAYYLSGAALTLLQDGRLFITGGSQDGSNFNPVPHTLFLTPGRASASPTLHVRKSPQDVITLSWICAPAVWELESSSDLSDWLIVSSAPTTLGEQHEFTAPAGDTARFFRLRRK